MMKVGKFLRDEHAFTPIQISTTAKALVEWHVGMVIGIVISVYIGMAILNIKASTLRRYMMGIMALTRVALRPTIPVNSMLPIWVTPGQRPWHL